MTRAIVTGTGGLGYEVALALAGRGDGVTLAGRDPAKGAAAVAAIRGAHPQADIRFAPLDLADLASVAAFADGVDSPVDLLVANAGVMALPTRRTTRDGFEMQLGTNHLGHFALTLRLLDRLNAAAGRVVSVSSLAHRGGAIAFADLQSERRYVPWRAYSQSKLAVLMFALELQRRADAGGWRITSNAAHPGLSATALIANGPAPTGLAALAMAAGMRIAGQSAARGALPILRAADAPEGGRYFGPAGLLEMRGEAAPATIASQALDRDAAARLWNVSERLTGISR